MSEEVFIPDHWSTLKRDTRRTQKAAFALGTYSNLTTQWRAFFLFCSYFGLTPLPAALDTICCYIEFLKRSFKSVTSIRNYIHGVSLLHSLNDLPFDHCKNLLVRMSFRGAAKSLFHAPKQAPPITVSMFHCLYEVVNLQSPLECTLYCACIFAFFALARKSSLFPPSKAAFSSVLYPTRSDVTRTGFGLALRVKYGKTNQFGDRNRIVPLIKLSDARLCPVAAFRRMCKLIPSCRGDLPLFCSANLVPLTQYDFDTFLRSIVKRAGLQTLGLTGHSFRRGGASAAFQAGVPAEFIQSLGGWSSDCYRLYLTFSFDDFVDYANRFAVHCS